MKSSNYDGGYTPENGEEKTLCVFLTDTSGSMAGYKITSVNDGLNQFCGDIGSHEILSQKVEVALVAFNSGVKVIQTPTLVENFNPPALSADGGTDMVGGILKAIELVRERKQYYTDHGIAYKRPWIVMLTDGYANVSSITSQIKRESEEKHYFLLPIAVDDGSDMDVLNSVASKQAFKLKDAGKFSSFFEWLSNSIGTIANAAPNTGVGIENPFDGWAA